MQLVKCCKLYIYIKRRKTLNSQPVPSFRVNRTLRPTAEQTPSANNVDYRSLSYSAEYSITNEYQL